VDVGTVAGLCSIGAFILGVGLAILSMRRRDKAERSAILQEAKVFVAEELKEHWRAEHQRDSENRTVRERVGLQEQRVKTLEDRCRERHGGG